MIKRLFKTDAVFGAAFDSLLLLKERDVFCSKFLFLEIVSWKFNHDLTTSTPE